MRLDIKKIIKKISKYDGVQAEFVGVNESPSELYQDFVQLRNKATMQELVELTNNDKLVIKGYVAWALVDDNYSELPKIFEKYLTLKDKVMYGCQDINSLFTQSSNL